MIAFLIIIMKTLRFKAGQLAVLTLKISKNSSIKTRIKLKCNFITLKIIFIILG